MDITSKLFEMQDIQYRDFQAMLTPSVAKEQFIGVRIPALRALAKELIGSAEAEQFLLELPHEYYDENNLHGLLISLMKDYEQVLEALERFLPYVDNWATCDIMQPKVFAKHTLELYPILCRWLESPHVYTVRFGIDMLMSYYLDKNFTIDVLDRVAAIRSTEYYINMCSAWFFATALAKQYDASIIYIENHRLDTWTHNKAIQKAIESRRISDEQKAYLRSLKLK